MGIQEFAVDVTSDERRITTSAHKTNALRIASVDQGQLATVVTWKEAWKASTGLAFSDFAGRHMYTGRHFLFFILFYFSGKDILRYGSHVHTCTAREFVTCGHGKNQVYIFSAAVYHPPLM